jgi:dolichyl-phosphate-mannose--protein O-mannosyl transferase
MFGKNQLQAFTLAAIALCFGLSALRYPLGDLSHPGAGLFPLLVSCLIFALATTKWIQSRLTANEPLHFSLRNIAIIMLALVSFVIASKFVSMIVGIVLLVFIASIAAGAFSWKRNLQISVALVLLALGFQKLLGLSLGVV